MNNFNGCLASFLIKSARSVAVSYDPEDQDLKVALSSNYLSVFNSITTEYQLTLISEAKLLEQEDWTAISATLKHQFGIRFALYAIHVIDSLRSLAIDEVEQLTPKFKSSLQTSLKVSIDPNIGSIANHQLKLCG